MNHSSIVLPGTCRKSLTSRELDVSCCSRRQESKFKKEKIVNVRRRVEKYVDAAAQERVRTSLTRNSQKACAVTGQYCSYTQHIMLNYNSFVLEGSKECAFSFSLYNSDLEPEAEPFVPSLCTTEYTQASISDLSAPSSQSPSPCGQQQTLCEEDSKFDEVQRLSVDLTSSGSTSYLENSEDNMMCIEVTDDGISVDNPSLDEFIEPCSLSPRARAESIVGSVTPSPATIPDFEVEVIDYTVLDIDEGSAETSTINPSSAISDSLFIIPIVDPVSPLDERKLEDDEIVFSMVIPETPITAFIEPEEDKPLIDAVTE